VAHAVLKTILNPGEEVTDMSNERSTQQGAVISALRQRLSMTQEEFAHAIGVTVSTVNRWENGHIEPSRLARKAMQGLAAQAAIPIDLEPASAPLIGHVSSGQVGKSL
jgi:DNA-binding transcriptional regulator YiaG